MGKLFFFLFFTVKWLYCFTKISIKLGVFCKKVIYNNFNKIAIQGSPQMAVDKEAIRLSRVYSYYSECYLPLFYV